MPIYVPIVTGRRYHIKKLKVRITLKQVFYLIKILLVEPIVDFTNAEFSENYTTKRKYVHSFYV